MTDLEMTKLCAEAMGLQLQALGNQLFEEVFFDAGWKSDCGRGRYDPLHDDAQAMALVKRLDICINVVAESEHIKKRYHAYTASTYSFDAMSDDLNRAIVECVAKMQSGTKP